MFPFPRRRLVIRSAYPPQVLVERLRAVTLPSQRWLADPADHHCFVGRVDSNAFTLVPVIEGRNTYQPRVRGRLLARPDGGAEMELTVGIHPGAAMLVLGLFSFAFVSALRTREYLSALIILVGFGAFHAVMCVIGFVPEADRAEDHLRRVAA